MITDGPDGWLRVYSGMPTKPKALRTVADAKDLKFDRTGRLRTVGCTCIRGCKERFMDGPDGPDGPDGRLQLYSGLPKTFRGRSGRFGRSSAAIFGLLDAPVRRSSQESDT